MELDFVVIHFHGLHRGIDVGLVGKSGICGDWDGPFVLFIFIIGALLKSIIVCRGMCLDPQYNYVGLPGEVG